MLKYLSPLLLISTYTYANPVADKVTPAKTEEIEILTGEIPPYTFFEGGQQKGLIVEMIEAMAKYTGHSGKIRFLPWKRALHDIQESDKIPRMIIPLNRSEEREFKFTWIQELYVDDTTFVTKKGVNARIDKVESALLLKTGVLLGSPLEAQLKRLGFKDIDSAVDEVTNAKKLNAGRIKVWHVARMVAPFVYLRQGLSTTSLEYGATMEPNDLYLAGTKNFPAAIAESWRRAFKKIKDNGTFAEIVKKYAFSKSLADYDR